MIFKKFSHNNGCICNVSKNILDDHTITRFHKNMMLRTTVDSTSTQ